MTIIPARRRWFREHLTSSQVTGIRRPLGTRIAAGNPRPLSMRRAVAVGRASGSSPGGGSYFLRPFEAAAPSFAAEPIAAPVHDAAEIEGAVAALHRDCAMVRVRQ